MKKITSVLALLLCILMLFASCGSSDKPLKLDKKELNTSKVATNFTSTELTTVGEGYTFHSKKNNLALFSKVLTDINSTNFKIINLNTNTVVTDKTITSTDLTSGKTSVSLSSKGSFIVIYENKTYTLYKADGVTAIGSAATAPKYVNDCVVIGDTVCRYDTETYEVKDIFTYPSLNGSLPTCVGYAYSSYYVSKITNGFTVYDSHYKYIGEYIFPDFAYDSQAFILKNGNVFVQYLVALPFDAEEYDILDNGAKFDLVQKIISAKKLSEKEVELDYYVSGISPINSDADGYLFKKDADNLATCYKIENRQFDKNNPLILSFSNKGKTRLAFDERYTSYTSIGNGYLKATTKSGITVILDGKLNVISTLSDVKTVTEKYIVTANAVYDFNFTKLADLGSYIFRDVVGNYPVFLSYDETQKEDYFIFDGAFNKIVDASEGQRLHGIYNNSLYAVSTAGDTETATRIYKADRTELAHYTDTVSFVSYGTNNGEEYFIIKAGQKYFFVSEAEASK